jgi:pimeloyl-ACP methyl ester carboxylesterase
MKTVASQIWILLLILICSNSSLIAQDFGDEYNSADVEVLRHITSQGGSWNCINWDQSKKPYRLYSLYLQNMRGSLDVTGCSSLHILECVSEYNNHLTSLKVNGCPVLQTLSCEGNQLSSLDVSGCSDLTSLWCSDNQLTTLNLSGCSKLTSLVCSGNMLTHINISGCPDLQSLALGCNQLTSIDVAGRSDLSFLECCSNQLTRLDVSGCSNLTILWCYTNQLASLKLNGCLNLQALQCEGNQLTILDVSDCQKLKMLSCEANHLTSLILGHNTALTDLDCSANDITSLNLENSTALTDLNCAGNNLTSLNLENNAALSDLNCAGNNLTSLNLKNGNNNIIRQMKAYSNADLYCIEVDDPIAALSNSSFPYSWHKDPWATYSTDCSSNPFSLENNWTISRIPGMPAYPVGVVADGSSAVRISLTRKDQSIAVERVEIKVKDINGNNIPVGQIGTSIFQATAPYLNLTYLPDNIFYVAPDVFSDDTNNTDWNRKVVVQIVINNNSYSGNGYALYDTIDIIRPPVLLIHGLNSNSACFADLREDLHSRSTCYISEQVLCVDYRETNLSSFAENAFVLPTNIRKVKEYIIKKGYAVSKVDIVGHSMGGILSRLYLQSSCYDNDIHKLITVNTPHSGSQGANVLFELPSIREKFGLKGKAVDDLQVTSFATRTLLNGSSALNKNRVPSHTIVTETPVISSGVGHDLLGMVLQLAYQLEYPEMHVDSVTNDIFNEANDIVVAVSSQRGGLSPSTLVENEWHCGSPKNATVKNRISKLLMLPSSDAAFSTVGFNPPTLDFKANIKNRLAGLKSAVNKNDSVYFLLPNIDLTANSGDSITIMVARTAQVKNMIFVAKESQDSVFIKSTTAASMRFSYPVPSCNIGRIQMYVFGSDMAGNVYIDSVFVTVSPNAQAKSLVITYPDESLLELPQGLKSSVRVACLFSDGIIRDITTLADVQYCTKTGNAVVLSQGIIKATHQGPDTLYVSYGGLNCSLQIIVNQDYTCAVNASVIPDHSGTTVGSGLYFYGDSVTLAAHPNDGYTFDFWSIDGVEVSTNSNYSFETYGRQDIVAHFKSLTAIDRIPMNSSDLVSIYPNPNNGNFTIDIDADYTGEVVVNIFSITGVLCDHIKFDKSIIRTTHQVNLNCLEKGIYFVNVLLGRDIVTHKIVIK